jgi:hypothetical protein
MAATTENHETAAPKAATTKPKKSSKAKAPKAAAKPHQKAPTNHPTYIQVILLFISLINPLF